MAIAQPCIVERRGENREEQVASLWGDHVRWRYPVQDLEAQTECPEPESDNVRVSNSS